MSNSNGVIAAPVSIGDVAQVLGVSSSDLGTLCANGHGKINKWARYKPERRDGPRPMTYAGRKQNGFGLEVPYCISWPDRFWTIDVMNRMCYDILFNSQNYWDGWTYQPPRGYVSASLSEYFRLSDFARIPTDDTDEYYGTTFAKGYNHNAVKPFNAYIDMSGATEDTSAGAVNRYEINRTATSNLVINFYNGRGDDIHLQDFITLPEDPSSVTASSVVWRPVLQVFDSIGGTNWYDRTSPRVQVAGDAITADDYGSWSVALPIGSGTFFDNYVDQNEVFHLCVGVGCCNKACTSWASGDHALFIVPYNVDDGDWPFYYEFKIVQHFDRDLQFDTMRYGTSGTATFSGSGVDIPSNATGAVGFGMTIMQSSSQKLHFVKYGQNPDTGYTALRIALEDPATHQLYYMIPTNSSYQASQSVYIQTGSSRVNIYGIPSLDGTSAAISVDSTSLPAGQYLRFQVKAFIGDSTAENAQAISIHKLSQ